MLHERSQSTAERCLNLMIKIDSDDMNHIESLDVNPQKLFGLVWNLGTLSLTFLLSKKFTFRLSFFTLLQFFSSIFFQLLKL